MKDLATHALNQLLRLSAYTLAKLVVKRSSTLSLALVVAGAAAGGGHGARRRLAGAGPGRGARAVFGGALGARFTRRALDWCAGGGRVLASPVVADGFVVTADLDGNIRAPARRRRRSWSGRWRCGSTVQGTPAIARGRVFVPTMGTRSWRCGSPTARRCGRATWAG